MSKMIPRCVAVMYAAGPGDPNHDAIVSEEYTMVSCGFDVALDGTVWAVQNFC